MLRPRRHYRIALPMLLAAAAAVTTTVQALSSRAPKPQYSGGAGVGRFVVDDVAAGKQWACHYDMVLCERLQKRSTTTESGLYVPQEEELPRLHLCRVVSLGPGREEENGLIAPMPDVAVGDVVIAKNPWGIGPKDEETADGRKLSFMRAQDIAAVVTGGLLEEEDPASKD